jgi:glycosyltransferase involved in cell wall biosynthesis
MPEITVLLPAFNAERTIAAALNSLLNQTHTSFDVIVVDDGSTDGTATVVGGFQDSRVRLVRSEHAGVSAATNLAASLTDSKLLARMDADDTALPDRLKLQQQMLEQHHLDVVGSQVRIVSAHGHPTTTLKRYERWINQETLSTDQIHALRFVEFPLVNPTLLARRAYFDLEFSDSTFPEDYDLMLRAAAQGFRFGKVPTVLLNWTDSETRLTRTDLRYSDTAFMQCRRFHLLSGPLADVWQLDVWGAGQTGKQWLRWLQAQGRQVRQLIDVNTRKIGQQIHGVPVIGADDVPQFDGVPMLIAVGADRTRNLIWEHIIPRGYQPGENAWFTA